MLSLFTTTNTTTLSAQIAQVHKDKAHKFARTAGTY